VAYTDIWSVYQAVLPSKRHRPVSKENGKANHIERINCTLQQRISRLGRKFLFLKNLKTTLELFGILFISTTNRVLKPPFFQGYPKRDPLSLFKLYPEKNRCSCL